MADPMHDDQGNWSRGPLKIYFARNDPRLIVPKYHEKFGWTFNFAHAAAMPLMIAMLLAPAIVAASFH